MELNEMFRNKLENAEIVPDPSVNTRLMRKLAIREFMTFNPARFNIYYLGGIVVAGITAALILSSGNSEKTSEKENLFLSQPPLKEEAAVASKGDSVKSLPDIQGRNSASPKKTEYVKGSSDRKSAQSIPIKKAEEPVPDIIDHSKVRTSPSKSVSLTNEAHDSQKLISSAKGGERYFISSVTEGCVPLKVKFIKMADDIDSCHWIFGDGGISYEKAPEWIFDVEGEYKVVLEMYSRERHFYSYSEVIKVHSRPVANFEITPEKPVIPEDEVRFLNYSNNAVKYLWDFGDGNHSELFEPQHRYGKYGNYSIKLTVTNEYGCSDSVLVQNAFSSSKYFIEFPNAFIPNTDGPTGGIYSQKSDESAQVFHPVYSGVTEYQLKIFSKMGILIFESNDINIGWDGYLNGQISNSGVYIWKVRGKYRNGEPFTKMGDLTLLKN